MSEPARTAVPVLEDIKKRITLRRKKTPQINDEDFLKHQERFLQENPLSFNAWEEKAKLLIKFKRYEEALADLEKSKALWPEYFYRWLEKAEVYCKLKKYEEAKEELRRCEIKIPQDWPDPVLYWDLEKIYKELGNRPMACKYAAKAREADLKLER